MLKCESVRIFVVYPKFAGYERYGKVIRTHFFFTLFLRKIAKKNKMIGIKIVRNFCNGIKLYRENK